MRSPYIHTEAIHNLTAPRIVVPMVIQMKNPKSVLDIGCGTGTWLRVFEEHGISEYLGVDGGHFNISLLKIPAEKFVARDLQKPFYLQRKFDLVVCLEVAEHLDEMYADQLVHSVANHGDTILFSAAIPGQGGQDHLNEQWPAYWQGKFERHGFYFHDSIRPLIWGNDQVEWWYQQNIFLLTKVRPEEGTGRMLSLVHPELHSLAIRSHMQYCESLKSGKQGLRVSINIFANAVTYKLKTLAGLK